MRGKYSPTVSAAYSKDQDWWEKFHNDTDEWAAYDREGYDCYGYNKNDIDRAGNHENDYIHSDDGDYFSGTNWKYEKAQDQWGFDGVKPVLRA